MLSHLTSNSCIPLNILTFPFDCIINIIHFLDDHHKFILLRTFPRFKDITNYITLNGTYYTFQHQKFIHTQQKYYPGFPMPTCSNITITSSLKPNPNLNIESSLNSSILPNPPILPNSSISNTIRIPTLNHITHLTVEDVTPDIFIFPYFPNLTYFNFAGQELNISLNPNITELHIKTNKFNVQNLRNLNNLKTISLSVPKYSLNLNYHPKLESLTLFRTTSFHISNYNPNLTYLSTQCDKLHLNTLLIPNVRYFENQIYNNIVYGNLNNWHDLRTLKLFENHGEPLNFKNFPKLTHVAHCCVDVCGFEEDLVMSELVYLDSHHVFDITDLRFPKLQHYVAEANSLDSTNVKFNDMSSLLDLKITTLDDVTLGNMVMLRKLEIKSSQDIFIFGGEDGIKVPMLECLKIYHVDYDTEFIGEDDDDDEVGDCEIRLELGDMLELKEIDVRGYCVNFISEGGEKVEEMKLHDYKRIENVVGGEGGVNLYLYMKIGVSVDDWTSGSNFNRVCRISKKLGEFKDRVKNLFILDVESAGGIENVTDDEGEDRDIGNAEDVDEDEDIDDIDEGGDIEDVGNVDYTEYNLRTHGLLTDRKNEICWVNVGSYALSVFKGLCDGA